LFGVLLLLIHVTIPSIIKKGAGRVSFKFYKEFTFRTIKDHKFLFSPHHLFAENGNGLSHLFFSLYPSYISKFVSTLLIYSSSGPLSRGLEFLKDYTRLLFE
jgi:hypothetical protein